MKVEMQSSSSEFDEYDDANSFRRSSQFNQRQNLWKNQNKNVKNNTGSGLYTGRGQNRASDDDFEFVITKSRNAMKVKRSGVESNDNYRRFSNGLESNRSRNSHFNGNNDSPFGKKKEKHRKNINYQPLLHPGLQKNINFDPFDSSSEQSSSNSELYNDVRYPTEERFNSYTHMDHDQKRYSNEQEDVFQNDDFLTTQLLQTNATNKNKYNPGCSAFIVKLKSFFKTVGFKIKKCFSKSKTYLSRMIKNKKQRRKTRKFRERLLPNQEYYEEYEVTSQPKTNIPKVYRQKINVPFTTNSNSTSSFEDINTDKPRKKMRFSGFRKRDSKKSKYTDPKKAMHHVKLHSFPDG